MADQGSEGFLSPFLRDRRIAAAKPFLSGRVLDVGCGSGLLASLVDPQDYVGVDIDRRSLDIARAKYPAHTFKQGDPYGKFDTIVALAVIEHVPSPSSFLAGLKPLLSPEGKIVCTTPHPSMDWTHWIGARLGVFSRSANDEHEELLNRGRLHEAGRSAGLEMRVYKRFLMGANQIAVFKPHSS